VLFRSPYCNKHITLKAPSIVNCITMLAKTLASRLVVRRSPLVAISGRYLSSIGDQLSSKEKVEEDKFVRAQTQQQIEKLRAEKEKSAADAQAALDTKLFAEQVLPSIKEVKALLKSSEQLSEETVEKIVRWKFGM